MTLAALVRSCRSNAPLVALIATGVLAIALAAQAQLVCSHAMQVAMPSMPGMASMDAMSGMNMPNMRAGPLVISLCPVVMMFAIAAILLTTHALVQVVRDPHRSTSTRVLARRCARLPISAVSATIVTLGSIAIGTMMAVDQSAPAGPAGWLCLAVVVAAIAVSTSVIAVGIARATLALTRRIVIVIARAIALATPAEAATVYRRSERTDRCLLRVPLLANCRGLRAPPSRLR